MFITNMSKSIWKNSYLKASRALRDGRNTNPAHKDAFNSLISNLRKKNPQWDRKSFDDHGSTTRALFMEENTDWRRNLIHVMNTVMALYLIRINSKAVFN